MGTNDNNNSNFDGMTKFLSFSHGALTDIDQEFTQVTHLHYQHSQNPQRKGAPIKVSKIY